LGYPILLANLSLSNISSSITYRKGRAGALYRTIAPITGVVYPISKYSIRTKVRQNKRRFMWVLSNLKKKRNNANKRSSIAFSIAANKITGDWASKM